MNNFVSRRVREYKEYVPGEQAEDRTKIIKLNANESYLPPTTEIKKFLLNFNINQLGFYPDSQAKDLVETIKKTYQLNAKVGVVVGNGADEIIRGIFKTFFDKKSNSVLLTTVTYPAYQTYAELEGVNIETLPMGRRFSIPLDQIKACKSRVVFITNPNSPTGIQIATKRIIACVKANPNKLFIIDEAYSDFVGDSTETCVSYLALPNLIVLKTLSKSFSVAGIRLGFGLGNIHLINSIRKVLDPYNVNVLTIELGKVILNSYKYMLANCKKVIENREWFAIELKKRGFKTFPSKANFIFCEPKNKLLRGRKSSITNVAEDLFNFLKKKNIYIRYFTLPQIKKYLRITIGSKKDLITLLKYIDSFYKS